MDKVKESDVLLDAYWSMAPEARKVLLGMALAYAKQFPAPRPVRLRLVSGGNNVK